MASIIGHTFAGIINKQIIKTKLSPNKEKLLLCISVFLALMPDFDIIIMHWTPQNLWTPRICFCNLVDMYIDNHKLSTRIPETILKLDTAGTSTDIQIEHEIYWFMETVSINFWTTIREKFVGVEKSISANLSLLFLHDPSGENILLFSGDRQFEWNIG